jgi:hypothetical protein
VFDRLSNSWKLVKASAAVLASDKELIIFPILSALGCLMVAIAFIVPSIFAGLIESATNDTLGQIVGLIVLFLFYVVQYTVIIFANSALIGAAMIRLRGGDPTVGDGFRIAFGHLGSILGYAVISATVGVILNQLSQRGGVLGRIASGLVGLAWNVATFLAVPVLVIENVGPWEAVKRSTAYLKKTWGEQVVGNLGIGTVFGLIFFLVIIAGVAGVFVAVMSESTALIITAAALFVLVLIVLGILSSTLSGIYQAAVYQYAADGKTEGFFSQELVANAFRRK